jgi:photosystem II stability/assembly factor-like uncharacterized protein
MEARTSLEERLRAYAREYDREFPGTGGVERRIVARITLAPARSARFSSPRWPWGMAGGLVRELAIVAVLLLLAGVLVVGATKLRSLPTRTVTPPVTATPQISKPALPPAYWTALHFVSANAGWIAETKANQTGAGPTFIYKTTDGGRTWQQQLTWDGPGPQYARFSANGSHGLLVGLGGVPLFKTVDGGADWQRMALPAQATQVALQYFLNADEGWIISYLSEATPGIAGVFHTTDGGQSWTQTARLDVNQDFSHGLSGGSLQGNLVFLDSSNGWITPANYSGTGITPVPAYLYVTHDGGKTWGVQEFAAPAAVGMNPSTASFLPPGFVNDREGVVLVTQESVPNGPGAPTIGATYAYTTSDGGDHWSAAQKVVIPGNGYGPPAMVVLDARTWLTFNASQLERTTDGGVHWESLAGGLPPNTYATELDFQDVNHGWLAAIRSSAQPTLAVFQTSDGGAHWTALTAPPLGGQPAGG